MPYLILLMPNLPTSTYTQFTYLYSYPTYFYS